MFGNVVLPLFIGVWFCKMAVTLVHVSKATGTIKTGGSVVANRNAELVPLIMTDHLTVSTKKHKHERGKCWQEKNTLSFSHSLGHATAISVLEVAFSSCILQGLL